MTTTHDSNPTQARTATPDDCDAVFVSAPMGEGAGLHRRIRKGPWEFTVPGADGIEPMVDDSRLADALGLERRALRQLIREHRDRGNINPIPILSAALTKSRGRPGEGFLLTEVDALFVVTRSNSPKAVALTREMISVYVAVRRGLLLPQAPPPELAAEVAAVRAAVARLEQELASGVIGPAVAEKEILVPLRRIAHLRGATAKLRRAWRSRVERQLRNLLGHARRGSTWARLDRRLLVVAQQQIGMWIDEAIAAARGRGAGRSDGSGGAAQQSLPLDDPKGVN